MAESEETKKFRQQMLAAMTELTAAVKESRVILDELRAARAEAKDPDDDD